MELSVLFFMSSGLFLGWSLGANDAANIFGTAVASRMVKFATAALLCSVFVILGSVISGAGAAGALNKLGAINTLPGSFMAAFSAAFTVMVMTFLGLPVSTTQAIVGGIIGWNLFSNNTTDYTSLMKILGTWVACPLLAGIFSFIMYKGSLKLVHSVKPHLLTLDSFTRWGLILVGSFGAYSLGANNIANVVGVFISSNPFTDFEVGGFQVTGIQQLFFIGAIAISVGTYTYGKKVMLTVGGGLAPLTPFGSLVVVLAESLVLFLFASEDLEHMLAAMGLPTIPLVPVSSSQAVVGAVIGIGLIRESKNIQWKVVGNIVTAWISTPVIAAFISFVMLFFLQNVFNQKVYQEIDFIMDKAVLVKAESQGVDTKNLATLVNVKYTSSEDLRSAIKKATDIPFKSQLKLIELAERTDIIIDQEKTRNLAQAAAGWLSPEQIRAVQTLSGKRYPYRWMLRDDLGQADPAWKFKEATILNKLHNKELKRQIDLLLDYLERKA